MGALKSKKLNTITVITDLLLVENEASWIGDRDECSGIIYIALNGREGELFVEVVGTLHAAALLVKQ